MFYRWTQALCVFAQMFVHSQYFHPLAVKFQENKFMSFKKQKWMARWEIEKGEMKYKIRRCRESWCTFIKQKYFLVVM